MLALGVACGIVFPPFVILLGVPADVALQPLFVAACLAAGASVAGANFFLARRVVGRRIRSFGEGLDVVDAALRSAAETGDWTKCDPESCRLPVESTDELGHAAESFNRLVGSLADAHRARDAVETSIKGLAERLELDAVATTALAACLEHTGFTAGAVVVEEQGELRLAAAAGLQAPERLTDSPLVGDALADGAPRTVSLPDDIEIDAAVIAFAPRDVLIQPLMFRGVPLGVLVLAAEDTLDPAWRGFVDALRAAAGVALHNAVMHSDLQRLAARDPLTDLYNRRFGLERLHEEFSRAVRGDLPLGVVMFDLDRFKNLNDTYGHLAGDAVLKAVSRAAHHVVREGDVLMRYGGEEYCAILPAASLRDCVEIAERIRHSIADLVVRHGENELRVTVSVGVASFPAVGEDENGLLAAADRALYRAKAEGRDRVIAADDEVALVA